MFRSHKNTPIGGFTTEQKQFKKKENRRQRAAERSDRQLVPLRAIARAIRIPSENLREQLSEAKADGRLLEIPHDDWPPGFPRDQRALQLSRLTGDNSELLFSAIRQVFGLTTTEIRLLLTLLQRTLISRSDTNRTTRTVDVHIYNMRKRLVPFRISITTLRGFGYQLSDAHRRAAMDLILARVAQNME